MKYRVRHFSGEYYTISYSFRWWLPASKIQRILEFSNPYLWSKRPEIFKQEDARNFIAHHDTPEKLRAFLRAQDDAFTAGRKKAFYDVEQQKSREFNVDL